MRTMRCGMPFFLSGHRVAYICTIATIFEPCIKHSVNRRGMPGLKMGAASQKVGLREGAKGGDVHYSEMAGYCGRSYL